MTTSPSTQQISSQQSEGKVRLTGQGLVSASCGEENHFTIDGSAAPEGGKPEVQISSQKTSLNVKLKNVGYNLYSTTASETSLVAPKVRTDKIQSLCCCSNYLK